GSDEDAITAAAIEAGADDVVGFPEAGSVEVLTSPENFESVRDAMAAAGLPADHAEVTMRAENDVEVTGDTAVAVRKMLDMLEGREDVQEVYHNAELDDAAWPWPASSASIRDPSARASA